MREVHDGLFVGGINAPIQNNIDFDRIVSLHMESENTTHAHPIYDGKHNYDEFSEAVDSVIDGLQNKEVILVNCQVGKSRSVSVATVALYETTDLSLYESLTF